MNKKFGLAAAGLAAALVLGGTAFSASASIPDSSGTIHGCYDTGGSLKVINTSATLTCPRGYRKLNWNQTGPVGPPGAGLTWTTTSTLPQPGTYLVYVEITLLNPTVPEISGSCRIGTDPGTAQMDDIIGYSGTYPPLPMPPGVPTTFSFSGIVTYASGFGPANLFDLCEDTNGNGPGIASDKWWITPIATS